MPQRRTGSASAEPENLPSNIELARYIDHTLLKPEAALKDIERLCAEARAHNFHAVCVNGSRVAQARHFLEGCAVQVATVVGFPLGATWTAQPSRKWRA